MVRAAKPVAGIPQPVLKTIHDYPSKNGNVHLHIYTYPQRFPTFMGGSADRGWGPLAGNVLLEVTDSSGDRVSAIKLTVSAILRTAAPKSASPEAPASLEKMSIEQEETKTKEITLLSIEKVLFEAAKGEQDSNLIPQGKHSYPFLIDLPAYGKGKGNDAPAMLPPSFVIEPLLVGASQSKARQNNGGIFGLSKGKDDVRPSWASIKYQLKLTVQRPGLLKRNVRVYAPFVYLPPPEASLLSGLRSRRLQAAQMTAIVLQHQGNGLQAIESPDWITKVLAFTMSPNGVQQIEQKKKSGLMSMLFGGGGKEAQVQLHEVWSMSMPRSAGSPFPLRSAIPFILRCKTNKIVELSRGSPLGFTLFRRVRLLTGKKKKALAMQTEPVCEAALRYALESRGVHRLNGIISLPPNCVPTFDAPKLALDYYIGVRRVLDGVIIHKEVVNLACPPPTEPQTAYGPWPSGPASRNVGLSISRPSSRQALSGKSAANVPVGVVAPTPEASSRPSVSDLGGSTSSQFPPHIRRPSATPSTRTTRTASTDSTSYHTPPGSILQSPTTPSQAFAPSSVAGHTAGLASRPYPPPSASTGAAAAMPPTASLAVGTPTMRAGTAPAVAQLHEPRRDTPSKTNNAVHLTDSVSMSSSKRRDKYSSRGAAPVPGPSTPAPTHDETRHHVHSSEKSQLTPVYEQSSSKASSIASGGGGSREGTAGSTTRRGRLNAEENDLPPIPSSAAASTRAQANALVGSSSTQTKSRRKGESDGRSRRRKAPEESRTRPPQPTRLPSSSDSASLSTSPSPPLPNARASRTSDGHRAVSAVSQTPASSRPSRRPASASNSRPIPNPPSPPTIEQHTTSMPPPTPPPSSDLTNSVTNASSSAAGLDPAMLLTNEDLMYGEDMELDLPPSYFEAVYGAEDDDD